MSIEKSKLKKLVFEDVGADAEDGLEAFQREASEYRGAKKGLATQAQKLEAELSAINKDLDEGVIGNLESDLEIAGYAKKYVNHCIQAVQNAARNAGNLELQSMGAINGMKTMMSRIGKRMEAEDKKMAAAEASAETGARAIGTRPPPSVAMERKAEAKKPKKKKAKKKSGKNSR